MLGTVGEETSRAAEIFAAIMGQSRGGIRIPVGAKSRLYSLRSPVIRLDFDPRQEKNAPDSKSHGAAVEQPSPEAHSISTARLACVQETEPVNRYSNYQLPDVCRMLTKYYNVNTKSWIAPSEAVEDIEQGKDKTTEYARIYLRHVADSELPPLEWKTSRSR